MSKPTEMQSFPSKVCHLWYHHILHYDIYIANKYPDIHHSYDVWHKSKKLKERIGLSGSTTQVACYYFQ